jgi:hypothetical protein
LSSQQLSTPMRREDYAIPEFGYLSFFDADPEVRRPLVSTRAVVPTGHDSRNGCVPVSLAFEGNGRTIAPHVRVTVNSRVVFLKRCEDARS